MEKLQSLGVVNGHIIGRVLKETVRRACAEIVAQRMTFEATEKLGYGGTMDDVLTTADKNAEGIYVRAMNECFPRCGIIGEEGTNRLPAEGCTAYFTVDPLDGTKAYVRRQSHGIGSMVALVHNGEVICAYVADVMANEIYGYRPGSDKVYRISRLDSYEQLEDNPYQADSLFALLRDPADKYSIQSQALIRRCVNHEVMGSSIGTWAARLWKGEVSALFIPPGHETPWDSTPMIGISLKLGYVFLRPSRSRNPKTRWEQYDPVLPTASYERKHDTLIVHRNNLDKI